MSTTSAYGWNIPDNTDLVKDGALAIRTLGNAIDTSMNTALGTKKAGMVLLNTTSFSGVSSQSVNTVFNSTYDNYYIEIHMTNATGTNNDITFKLRNAGTDKSTNYLTKGSYLSAATIADYGSGTTTGVYLANVPVGPLIYSKINVSRPAISGQTTIMSDAIGSNETRYIANARQTETTTFDSFTLITSGGTITGTVSTYGYNK